MMEKYFLVYTDREGDRERKRERDRKEKWAEGRHCFRGCLLCVLSTMLWQIQG